jgi:hypothetical protein
VRDTGDKVEYRNFSRRLVYLVIFKVERQQNYVDHLFLKIYDVQSAKSFMFAYLACTTQFSDAATTLSVQFLGLYAEVADHSGRVVYGMNRLRQLENLDRGFESQSRRGCLCASMLLCV